MYYSSVGALDFLHNNGIDSLPLIHQCLSDVQMHDRLYSAELRLKPISYSLRSLSSNSHPRNVPFQGCTISHKYPPVQTFQSCPHLFYHSNAAIQRDGIVQNGSRFRVQRKMRNPPSSVCVRDTRGPFY